MGGECMIVINLDVMMAKRKIGLTELASHIDLTQANLSILKNGKGRAIRFSTLDRLCKELGCQPGDILEYVEGEDNNDDR
ncbi:MAG: helix-turn-helix transcriptional regulator [Oscillospiraceae bacterium]|jgi:putative transcriptional regulator|nr:helix-turn-helix transcriptional regulator [Oscillospiraceae bacterium]